MSEYDTDGGYDTHVDMDGDGHWDPHSVESDGHGGYNIIVHDGDNTYVGHDTDGDGILESVQADYNGDGVVDETAYDDNGDGWMDRHVPSDGGENVDAGAHGGDAAGNPSDTGYDSSFGGLFDGGRTAETNPYASS
jgi:hypothetical protein